MTYLWSFLEFSGLSLFTFQPFPLLSSCGGQDAIVPEEMGITTHLDLFGSPSFLFIFPPLGLVPLTPLWGNLLEEMGSQYTSSVSGPLTLPVFRS